MGGEECQVRKTHVQQASRQSGGSVTLSARRYSNKHRQQLRSFDAPSRTQLTTLGKQIRIQVGFRKGAQQRPWCGLWRCRPTCTDIAWFRLADSYMRQARKATADLVATQGQ